jgi:uncharacterized membrane protein YdjX (TVP38/TMEM64 family)
VGLAVLLLVVLVVVPRIPFAERLLPRSFEDFQRQVESFSPYDRVAYVVLYALGTLLFIPGTVLSFVGATLFGTVWGTVLTWMGAVLGSTLTFLIVRLLGRDGVKGLVDRLFAGRFEQFDRWMDRNGFGAMLLVRLLPIFPFNGVNFGAGLTKISLAAYVGATAIGILPGTFVYQYLFASVGQRILKEGVKLEYFADVRLLVPIGLFIAFLWVGRLLMRRLNLAGSEAKKGTGTSQAPSQSPF